MAEGIAIRRAVEQDALTVAGHRVAMIRDMGILPAEQGPLLERAAETYLRRAIPAEIYVGWLATPEGRPGEVIAGAGIQLRESIPRLRLDRAAVDPGPQGLIVNVYTEPAWRRRGIAERLMGEILRFTREHGVDNVVLHASAEGRSLYEKLGFKQTNEMRYEA
ncbi:MAG TPA: GNAT family N-acetyltransferase [Gemmatimonadales bacterium]|nr:GNAT family N-acetyltransferase [Gemmatimonadales bacterium]